MDGVNAGAERDELGRGLTLTVRIAPDGRVFFHDLTADLLAVAAAVCPESDDVRRRLEVAMRFKENRA